MDPDAAPNHRNDQCSAGRRPARYPHAAETAVTPLVDTRTCSCDCHTGPYASCSVPGGCGSIGCGRRTKAGGCVLCPVYRPAADPRDPHRPPVCDGDRRLLHSHLGDIANLIADLTNPEPPVVDQRQYERFVLRNVEGVLTPVNLGETWADPLAHFGGVAPINSRGKAPTVTGSRERPLPIRADVEDLKAPARVPEPSPAGRDWPEDQIGYLSAATVLDQWVRDVRDLLYPDHHLPPATVDQLAAWLRNRVEDICDRHPAVADFAEELRHLRGALRVAAGQTDPPPERCDGVPCRHCDLLTLFREPGGDIVCVNVDCQAVLRDDEYQDWVKTLAAEQRVKRHAQQNA